MEEQEIVSSELLERCLVKFDGAKVKHHSTSDDMYMYTVFHSEH